MATKEKLKNMLIESCTSFKVDEKDKVRTLWNMTKLIAEEIDALKQEITELKQQLK